MVVIQVNVNSYFKNTVKNKRETFNKMIVNIINLYLKQGKDNNISIITKKSI